MGLVVWMRKLLSLSSERLATQSMTKKAKVRKYLKILSKIITSLWTRWCVFRTSTILNSLCICFNSNRLVYNKQLTDQSLQIESKEVSCLNRNKLKRKKICCCRPKTSTQNNHDNRSVWPRMKFLSEVRQPVSGRLDRKILLPVRILTRRLC